MFNSWIAVLLSTSFTVATAYASKPPQKQLLPTSESDWNLDIAHGQGSVEFTADVRPGFFKIHGVGEAPKGEIANQNGTVTGELNFNLESLDTGINQRNAHMRDKYLETSKFPQAKFTIDSLNLPPHFLGQLKKALSVEFSGRLFLHGVEKAVRGLAEVIVDSDKVEFTSHFPIKLENFNIDVPHFAGVSVGDEIQVTVKDNAPILKKD